ncbi:MAG TPA: glucosaminidase domain-containing protein [Roseateles sp.]
MKPSVVCLTALILPTACLAQGQAWGCYDPKPGHPTNAEKASFVARVSALAIAAEQRHGVPAPAIAAMAMVESGYGWTRTALQAHNFFGWKFYGANAAGGRPSYVLDCQPPEDVNNRYVVFASDADAVDFVAGKLASLPVYRPDAEAYRLARAAGQPAQAAVNAWLTGIADPYNWRPAEYVRTVTRFMNDPLSPSDQVAADRNLYRLALAAPASAPAASAPGPQDAQLLVSTREWFAARVASRSCEPAVTDFPRWAGFPVRRCSYSDGGVEAHTFMLNPTPEQLARWTLTACDDAQAADATACARVVAQTIWSASSGVFPVAGFIPEPAASGGGQGQAIQCFLFRDGVTVATAAVPAAPLAAGPQCPAADNDGAVIKARRFARVASTTRADYLAAGGTAPVGTDGDGDPRWLDAVRDLYQQAWSSDRNALISAKARSLKAAHKFP